MTWSYSRISSFSMCPYKFYLKYLYGSEDEELFFASYGKYAHSIIEKYLNGDIPKDELGSYYLEHYTERVKGVRPSGKVSASYLLKGLKYFEDFEGFP